MAVVTGRRIAVANQKGGVGKTATVLGLVSAILVYLLVLLKLKPNLKLRVLVVDCDPQANATNGLGVDVQGTGAMTVADLIREGKPGSAADAIMPTKWELVDVIPATTDLAGVLESGGMNIAYNLDIAFEGVDLSKYVAVFFDCPPTLGNGLFIPLVAARELVAVAAPEVDSVKGLNELKKTVDKIVARANPALRWVRIVINGMKTGGEYSFRADEIRSMFGGLVSPTVINTYVTRADAHGARMPVHQYPGSKAPYYRDVYDSLAVELGLIEKDAA